jgi:VWFA-related protein
MNHPASKSRGATPRTRHLWSAALLATALAAPVSLSPQESASNGEINSQETRPQFRIQVERNLVQVRVVVRDDKGNAVGNLTKSDFILTDDGKEQVISHFEVVDPHARAAAVAPPPEAETEEDEGERPAQLPERYIGFFFDDVHMHFGDLARVRESAEKYLATAQPSDRIGIFTSSGQNQMDFTDDLGKIHEALRKLLPRPIVVQRTGRCPEVSDYQAYLIIHRRDPYALEIAMEEAKLCDPAVQMMAATGSTESVELAARASAEFAAYEALNSFQTETEFVLRGLRGLIRVMAALPGQRTLVMVSPGFMMVTAELEVSELIDQALRASVVVNALDAKGLYAPVIFGDASSRPVLPVTSARLVGNKARIEVDRINQLADAMRVLTNGTGGVLFTNNNDLDLGFRQVGALPEVYYVLAFSPQNMKFNGNFHRIKVKLASKAKLTIQARQGYYAPKKPTDPTAQEREEIAQAVFSQAEVRELPVSIQTQFFKLSDTQARLAVLTHLDLGVLQFRKENGRNLNTLTVVTVLFDRNGKYLDGKEKKVEFRLLDTTYEKLLARGITSKTSFDVIPGRYVVRLVVRDSEGAQLSALNRQVEIPL